jgi:hypothetical protein
MNEVIRLGLAALNTQAVGEGSKRVHFAEGSGEPSQG